MADLQEVQKTAKEARDAIVGVKEMHEEMKGKLDALDGLDTEKFEKMSDSIATAMEANQKFEATQKGIQEQVDKLVAAASRPGASEKKEEIEEAKNILSSEFNNFLKTGAGSERADFADYMDRKGDKVFTPEVKALAVNRNEDGGFLVMPAFGGIIDVRIFESSPIRALANIETISTDALELVLDNDEASCGWTGETGTVSETDTPTIDKRVIPVHEMYAEPRATQKLLDDAIVDMESWLANKVVGKFGRTEATAFVSGTGATQPTGILTNTTTGTSYDADDVQIVASATQGAVAYADLIDVQNALKEAYHANATWLFKRSTNAVLMKLVDGNSRPIFNPQYNQNGGLEMALLGRPSRFADDVPAVANDANAMIYGDFRQGYTIVDRIGIRVLRDPFTAKPYVKFYTTKRVGGDVVNTEAMKILGLTG